MHIHIWQRLKNIGLVTGLGGLFATRFVAESGRPATNPHCDKPFPDCSRLHRGPRQGFVTERPRQRYVTEGAQPYRGPKDSMNIRILHSFGGPRQRGFQKLLFLGSLCILWSVLYYSWASYL